ncbi:MAG: HK97 family phage prohead protease [Dehalococcoidia bacterium]
MTVIYDSRRRAAEARVRRTAGDRAVLRSTARLAVADVDTNTALTRLAGRAVSYTTLATRFWYRLRIGEGSFDKSIKESAQSLPLLLFHDMESFPIGRAVEWDSRPSDGLWGVWALDDHPDAQRAARLARDGHMTGLSVGFEYLRSTWEEPSDAADWDPDDMLTWETRTLHEGRLLETSLLPAAAMPDAHVTEVLSHAKGTPELDRWKAWRASL